MREIRYRDCQQLALPNALLLPHNRFTMIEGTTCGTGRTESHTSNIARPGCSRDAPPMRIGGLCLRLLRISLSKIIKAEED